MHIFNLKILPQEFKYYALNYEYQTDDILKDLSLSAKRKKYLSKSEFLEICKWKTPRSQPLCLLNSEDYIKEITHISLTTKSDQLAIEILTLLNGVSWPTASAILHFCHVDEYPILDFRALFTLGFDKTPKYNYQFWKDYTSYCRELGKRFNSDLRTVDRALWQYSKKHQKSDKQS